LKLKNKVLNVRLDFGGQAVTPKHSKPRASDFEYTFTVKRVNTYANGNERI